MVWCAHVTAMVVCIHDCITGQEKEVRTKWIDY